MSQLPIDVLSIRLFISLLVFLFVGIEGFRWMNDPGSESCGGDREVYEV